MFDYHLHSHFSGDCDVPMRSIVQAALQAGIEELCFTDHIDLEYMLGTSFEFDPVVYIKEIQVMQALAGRNLSIRAGVEVGLQAHVLDKTNQIVRANAFDFVIASFHGCEGQDFFFGDFFAGKTPKGALEIYVNEALNMLETYDNFDVLGHLDIPKRYSQAVASLAPEKRLDMLRPLLERVIAMGKGIEINTSGWRQPVGVCFPDPLILKAYYDLGGRVITLGSDSHGTDTLCADFSRAVGLLREIGFTEAYRFHKRVGKAYPLEEWVSIDQKA